MTRRDSHAASSRRMSNLRGVVLFTAFAAIAVGVGWFFVARGGSSLTPNAERSPELTPEVIRTARFVDMDDGGQDQAERKAKIEAQEADWASSEFLPAKSPISTLVAAWRPSVHDVENVLTAAQRDALLHKLAQYVRVRAESSPAAYFELAEHEPNLAWHEADAPYWESSKRSFRDRLGWLYENYGGGESDPDATTPELLRDLWPVMMGKHGQRIAEVGVGEQGAAIIIMRSRLPATAVNGGFSEPYASFHGLDVHRWVGDAVTMARPFRVPTKTSSDILEDRGIVTLAAAHVLVRLAISEDHLFSWGVYFFLDPDTGDWRAEAMDRSGARNGQFIF